MSQKVNRNFSPQRNFSINITFENILHKEVHYATSQRQMEEEHVETSCLNTELEGSLWSIQGRQLHQHKLFRVLIQAACG